MRPLPLVPMLVGLFLSLAAAGDRTLPPPPTALALTSEPNAAGMKPIEAYASAVFGHIASGTPEETKEVRKAAASLLRKSECTLVFYNAFLKASKPTMDPILASTDGFRATNALFVVRHVRSPEAVALMLRQCSPSEQKTVGVRIAAGSMLEAMIADKFVPATDSDRVARTIRENIQAESSPIAATRSVEALAALVAAADNAKLAAQARGALTELIAAARIVANRTGEASGHDFAAALFRALIGIRDQCVKMPAAEQKSMGGNAALNELLAKVASLQIAPAGASADAARELTSARAVAEALTSMTGTSKPAPAKK